MLRISKPLTGQRFEAVQRCFHLVIQDSRNYTCLEVLTTCFSLDRETGWNWQVRVGHLRQPCPFATKLVLHAAISLSASGAEEEDELWSLRRLCHLVNFHDSFHHTSSQSIQESWMSSLLPLISLSADAHAVCDSNHTMG